MGIVGKHGLLKVKHNHAKCTDCLDCFKVCPEEQILSIIGKSSGLISSGECTNCGRCIEICKDGALAHTMNYLESKYTENQ